MARILDAAYALFAATAQMGLALRESQEPVAELGALLARMSETGQLQADAFKGIQQLQFYDRMVQHLTHLQEYLIAVANELGCC